MQYHFRGAWVVMKGKNVVLWDPKNAKECGNVGLILWVAWIQPHRLVYWDLVYVDLKILSLNHQEGKNASWGCMSRNESWWKERMCYCGTHIENAISFSGCMSRDKRGECGIVGPILWVAWIHPHHLVVSWWPPRSDTKYLIFSPHNIYAGGCLFHLFGCVFKTGRIQL